MGLVHDHIVVAEGKSLTHVVVLGELDHVVVGSCAEDQVIRKEWNRAAPDVSPARTNTLVSIEWSKGLRLAQGDLASQLVDVVEAGFTQTEIPVSPVKA